MDFRRPCFAVPPLPLDSSSSSQKKGNAKRNRRRREQRKRQKLEENHGNNGSTNAPDDNVVGKDDSNVEINDHLSDKETVDTTTTTTTTNTATATATSSSRKNHGKAVNDVFQFDDISTMNATEYLQRVVCQANQLPEIFTSTTSSASSSLPTAEQHRQQPAVAEASQGSAYRIRANNKNKGKLFPGSVSASLACFTKEDNVSSSLVGHLPLPPPTIHHLPTPFSASASSSSRTEYDTTNQEWMVETLESFQQLRWYLDQVREATKNDINNNNHGQRQRQPVPALRDRPAWQVFCLGQAEAEGNVGSYFDDDHHDGGGNDVVDDNDREVQETDAIKNDTNSNNNDYDKAETKDDDNMHNDGQDEHQQDDDASPVAWRQHLPETGFAPTVSLLLQMDQVMVRAVLRNLAHVDSDQDGNPNNDDDEDEFPPLLSPGGSSRANNSSLRLLSTPSRTSWMYALLACLEKPLHRQEAACLYQLVKQLCLWRASMTLLPPPPPTTTTTTTSAITTSSFNQQEYDQQRQELARCNVLITILAIYFEQGGERVMQVAKTS